MDDMEIKQQLDDIMKQMHELFRNRMLRIGIIAFIILALIIDMAFLYTTANSLSIEDKDIESITPTGNVGEYRVKFVLEIDNPTSRSILVDDLDYEAYLETEYLGYGEKSDLKITPGLHKYSFVFDFKVNELPEAVATLFIQESATIYVTGDVTVPVRLFGLARWTTITLPYTLVQEVSASDSTDKPTDGQPPDEVSLGQPIPQSLTSVQLSWSVSQDLDFLRYEVHMSKKSQFHPSNTTLQKEINDAGQHSYTITGLDRGEHYYFKIKVVDAEGLSSVSNEEHYYLP